MVVNVFALGKLREEYYKQAGAEYEKRLTAHCKLRVTELEPDKRGDIEKEAELLNRAVPKSYKIALCPEGARFTSEQFAKKLSDIGQSVSFIIGSSEGLSESVKRGADLKLSLSDMTFPHRLARIMLLEQLYRAFSINNNSKYHK
jgi:23S rRNA (pseudouridine1915-N3)-methyltransferase